MKKEADSKGKLMHISKWLAICNEEDVDGEARVITDDERVLHVD